MLKRLTRDFFSSDTIEVARDLLGMRMVRVLANGQVLSGRVVETEAYIGVEDPAAHSFGARRTPRTEVMYGECGTSYIYFIYGIHFCLNVVTAAVGDPQAVLIRALEPLEGIEHMGRPPDYPRKHIANGPGKLCQAFQIGRAQNGLDLVTSPELWFADDGACKNVEVVEGPRVGIGDRHDAVYWPLRFGIAHHPSLSRPTF